MTYLLHNKYELSVYPLFKGNRLQIMQNMESDASTTHNIYGKVRNYWNERPCNVKHSSKKFQSKEYFDEVEQKKYFVEPHIPGFADFSKWKGKKVLEIGCGIGTDSINFARAGAILTVIDYSEKSLEICKERFKVYGLTANFYHGNAEELSKIVPVETYELIYSFGVIHHTPHPENVFREIPKYMNAHTELRVMLYSKISWKLFWVLFEQQKNLDKNQSISLSQIEEQIRLNSEAQYGCPVTFTYTFDEIKKMVNPFGINVNTIWKDHIFMYDIDSYKCGVYKLDSYWNGVSDSIKQSFCNELGWHTMFIAKISNKNSDKSS